MATISSTIELYDNFSSPMRTISESVRSTTKAVDDLQSTLNNSMDASAIDDMANSMNDAGAACEDMNRTMQQTPRNISQETRQQQDFNNELKRGETSANNLGNLIKTAVKAYTGIAGVRKAVSWIEECTDAFNTQLNAENQLMVVLGNMLDEDMVAEYEVVVSADTSAADASAAALQAEFETITAKASEIQSEGIYGDEGMIAAAAEFATYFTDTDAITMMMDTLADYAMGMSGGGELDTQALVDYATNLGKVTTGSYDSMTKKGFEFSDVQKEIIEGVATETEIVEALGEEYLDATDDMRAAAAISQVIEESWGGLYETMSDTPEGRIIQLNNAFGDLQETVGGQLYPFVMLFVDAITENWSTIEAVINGITAALQVVMGVLSSVLNVAISVANAIIDNWSWIAPIIAGVAAALVAYNAIQLATAAGQAIVKAATTAWSTAQAFLNGELYACPLTWIVIAIIAVVAAIYAAVAAVNKITGSTISATGVITGVLAEMGAFIGNLLIQLWNQFAAIANFFGNVFNAPVASIKILFYDMCLTIIGYIQNMASAIESVINKIPGVTVDITSGLDSFYNNLAAAQQEVKDESDWTEYVARKDYIDYGDAWDAGYSFGEGIADTVSNLSISDIFGAEDIASAEDYLVDYSGSSAVSGIADDIDEIAGNSGSIAQSLECSDEELKYLRDIAEQETVNRFTMADVTIEQTNNNNISSGMDLDGVISGLTDGINEAIEMAAEGVHT